MKQTKDISVLKDMALKSLEGHWGLAIAAVVVSIISSIIISFVCGYIPYLGGIVSLIIEAPLQLGLILFILSLSRGQEATIEQLFKGFNNFQNAALAYLLMGLFILLWSLLLIIPGIIAAISYSMTLYIMADDESITPMQAIDKSKQMMDGYKMKFFVLGLSFIGWSILCILTLGIGLLWLIPYIQVTTAKFYDDIKPESQESFHINGDVLDTNI